MQTRKRTVTKEFTWNQYRVTHLHIWENGSQVDRIQLFGFDTDDDVTEYQATDDGTDEIADPLAFALVRPGQRDSLWIDSIGNIGENEGLLDALIAAEIVAAPHHWLEEQPVCKLLV
jgi:hypothetical protein